MKNVDVATQKDEAVDITTKKDEEVDATTDKGEMTERRTVPLGEFIAEKKKRQQLEKDMEKINADKRKEEEDKLKEKGEFQKLLDAKEKEFEAIKPKADAFDELRLSEIEEAKKSLGDKWLDEYANLSLPTLRKTVTALKAQLVRIPSTDNGGGGDPPVITLTPDQKKEAKQMYPYITEEKAYEYYMHNLSKMKVKEKK